MTSIVPVGPTLPPNATPIGQVQGSGSASPFEGERVTVHGVVTAIQRTGADAGFYLQDAAGDGDASTSDGIYVRMSAQAAGWQDTVSVGTRAAATGLVSERSGLTAVEVAKRSGLVVSGSNGRLGGSLRPTAATAGGG